MSEMLNDTTWPKTFVDILTGLYKRRSQMLGVYVGLLSYCFPMSLGYEIAPYSPEGKWNGAPEFVISDEDERPLVYAEVYSDGTLLEHADARLLADQRVRQRVAALLPECHIPTLYGISIIGIMMRTYRVDVATGQVTPVQDDWSLDVRSQAAFDEVKQILVDTSKAIAVDH